MRQRLRRIKLSPRESFDLLVSHVGKKLRDQLRSVLPIVAYLLLFQILILRVPLRDATTVAIGVGVTIMGLAVFLEGLLLGLMPLGEQIGVAMPRKWPLAALLAFALVLGAAATMAEPAIGVLRAAGAGVKPWEVPLLHALLNRYSRLLVVAIAAGVGIATVVGMLRFRFGWSLKPLAIALAATGAALTIATWRDPNLRAIAGLAWDSGGITTGPVTVPLVLALGIGICRSAGTSEHPTAGFGVVTLASLLPVVAVLGLGLALSSRVPAPMTREAFADPENAASIARLYEDEAAALAAQESARRGIAGAARPDDEPERVIRRSSLSALQAVLPLCLFLALVLFIALRERLPHLDEVVLGIGLALIGMALLQAGLEVGLTRLGGDVGARLPAAFTVTAVEERTTTIREFDEEMIVRTILPNGETQRSVLVQEGGRVVAVPYDPARHDRAARTYVYIPSRAPLVGENRRIAGLSVVLLFALVLGYAATLAEPALAALGVTVEELSVGTFRKTTLVRAVALGVGIGMAFGVARIVWNIPLVYLLVPPYVLVAILTLFSTEDYVNVAWDSAGVTTGPVTVPLVVAMGLGIGGQVSGITEGFGILALASVYPILTVLLSGLRAAARERALPGR